MIKKMLIFVIRTYQIFLSPILGNNCKYYPSCSNYAIEAIRKKPLHISLYLIIHRLLRCNPWSKGGYDPV